MAIVRNLRRSVLCSGRVRQLLSSFSDLLPESASWKTKLALSVVVFAVSLGVRVLHYQDMLPVLRAGQLQNWSLSQMIDLQARVIMAGGGYLFPNNFTDLGDGTLLWYPPGYPVIVSIIYRTLGAAYESVQKVQCVWDSLSAVLVSLIASSLFGNGIALLAGLLVALSPHLAYHANWIMPDSTPALPILAAVYCLIWAQRLSQRRFEASTGHCGKLVFSEYLLYAFAGALLGAALWIRSNSLLLNLLLGATIYITGRPRKLKPALVLIVVAWLVVLPITIRNYILYRAFVPVSLGMGWTLMAGLADYDKSFGFPSSDNDLCRLEEQEDGAPAGTYRVYAPDGIRRERARLRKAVTAIRERPHRFISIMWERAWFFFRYNDSDPADWPTNTAIVGAVSALPPDREAMEKRAVVIWSKSGSSLIESSTLQTPETKVFPISYQDGQAVKVVTDQSTAHYRLASEPIEIKPTGYYLLSFDVKLEKGGFGCGALSGDGSRWIVAGGNRNPTNDFVQMKQMFYSEGESKIQIVFFNDVPQPSQSIFEIRNLTLAEIKTSLLDYQYIWRKVVHLLQKAIFTTTLMRALIILGIILALLCRRWREALLVAAAPIYYVIFQSALHTEYRYILPVHYFAFIFAAISIYLMIKIPIRKIGDLKRRLETGSR